METEPLTRFSATRACPCCGREVGLGPHDVFCEGCGHELAVSSVPADWEVEVDVDRSHFERVACDAVAVFPSGRVPTSFPLTADEVVIGRRSPDQRSTPDIDLSGALADPGVSHRHAMLRRRDEGEWSIVDLGSTNGTFVGDSETRSSPGAEVAVVDGSSVRVGAWTRITIHRRP